jgi:formate dehydrogenase iron-sulfur subunit
MAATTAQTVEKRVLVDVDRCIECQSCAASCHYSHADMPAIGFARGGWALLPVICRQCKAAACVDVCPVEAMVRDDCGVVRRRLFRCTGCGCCARACPFGAIPEHLAGDPAGMRSTDWLTGHQVGKCDLCKDRLAAGPDVVPRCVAACPSGALCFADEHEAEDLHLQLIGGRSMADDLYKRR